MKNWIVSSGMVEVHCDKIEEKERSIWITVDGKKYNLPRSQIDYREWSTFVEVPVWLAEEKGLI